MLRFVLSPFYDTAEQDFLEGFLKRRVFNPKN